MPQQSDHESWDSAVGPPANLLPAPEQSETAMTIDHEFWDSAVGPPANLLHTPEQIGTSTLNDHVAPEQGMTSQFTCSKEPTKSDWDRLRPEIEMLYTKHKLKDIMAIMKEKYNLRASKNIKSKEKEAIVRKSAQRRLQAGKESYFQLRSTWVTDAKINRYRRDKKILSEQQAMALRAPTPLEFLCYTPLASPLTTPRELEIPERLIKVVHEYINSSFDSDSWIVSASGWCNYKRRLIKNEVQEPCFNLYLQILSAAQLLLDGKSNMAWQSLQHAMSLVAKVVAAEEPQTAFLLVTMVLQLFIDYRLPDIAVAVLSHFHNMSTKLMGELHPLSQTLRFVKELVASQNLEALLRLHQVGIDGFTSRVGRFSRDAIELQLDHVQSSSIIQHNFDSVGALQALLKSVRDVDSAAEAYLTVQVTLARELRLARRFQEALEICESVAKLASHEEYAQYLAVYVSNALDEMSICQGGLGDWASAKRSIRQAINIAEALLGFDDELVLSLLMKHELLLERCDALDEAKQVREYYERLVASKYERVFREEEEAWQRFQALEGEEELRTSSDRGP